MKKIVKILKQFEQTDYKRGGVSIAPEMYEAIARTIKKEIIEPLKKERNNARIQLQDMRDGGY